MFSKCGRNLFVAFAILFSSCGEKKTLSPLTNDTTFSKHVPGVIEYYHITAKLIDKPDFTPKCGTFMFFDDYHFIMKNKGDTVLLEIECPEFYRGVLFTDSTYDITASLISPPGFPEPITLDGEAPAGKPRFTKYYLKEIKATQK